MQLLSLLQGEHFKKQYIHIMQCLAIMFKDSYVNLFSLYFWIKEKKLLQVKEEGQKTIFKINILRHIGINLE